MTYSRDRPVFRCVSHPDSRSQATISDVLHQISRPPFPCLPPTPDQAFTYHPTEIMASVPPPEMRNNLTNGTPRPNQGRRQLASPDSVHRPHSYVFIGLYMSELLGPRDGTRSKNRIVVATLVICAMVAYYFVSGSKPIGLVNPKVTNLKWQINSSFLPHQRRCPPG